MFVGARPGTLVIPAGSPPPVVRLLSFKRRRFPPDVIRPAVWLYFRFPLSFRDVEELLAQRGIDVTRQFGVGQSSADFRSLAI